MIITKVKEEDKFIKEITIKNCRGTDCFENKIFLFFLYNDRQKG